MAKAGRVTLLVAVVLSQISLVLGAEVATRAVTYNNATVTDFHFTPPEHPLDTSTGDSCAPVSSPGNCLDRWRLSENNPDLCCRGVGCRCVSSPPLNSASGGPCERRNFDDGRCPTHFVASDLQSWCCDGVACTCTFDVPQCDHQLLTLAAECLAPPAAELPAIIEWDISSTDAFAVFIFDSEASSYEMAKTDGLSCQEVISAGKGAPTLSKQVNASLFKSKTAKQVMATHARTWYVVAAACGRDKSLPLGSCPDVTSATVSFTHTNPDVTGRGCVSGLISNPAVVSSVEELKSQMKFAFAATAYDNIVDIPGLSPAGVAALYLGFTLYLLVAMTFFLWALRSSLKRPQTINLRVWAFFVAACGCMCYLLMATGQGVLVQRKLPKGFGGSSGGWRYGNDDVLLLEGTPLYSQIYADAPVYTIFLVRYLDWAIFNVAMVSMICIITGSPRKTLYSLVICTLLLIASALAGALIIATSKISFWAIGAGWFCLLNAGLFLRVMPDTAGHPQQRQLRMTIWALLGFWLCQPWIWIATDGTHAASNTTQVWLFFLLDIARVVFLGSVARLEPRDPGVELTSERRSANWDFQGPVRSTCIPLTHSSCSTVS